MYRTFNAGKRANSLACLMVATSLWPLAVQAQQAGDTTQLPTVEVTAAGAEPDLNTTPQSLYETPVGQVETTIPADCVTGTQAFFSVFDVLRDSPGLSLKQGNGPRDIGISIRGSNAQVGFAIRNIQEDGRNRTAFCYQEVGTTEYPTKSPKNDK